MFRKLLPLASATALFTGVHSACSVPDDTSPAGMVRYYEEQKNIPRGAPSESEIIAMYAELKELEKLKNQVQKLRDRCDKNNPAEYKTDEKYVKWQGKAERYKKLNEQLEVWRPEWQGCIGNL